MKYRIVYKREPDRRWTVTAPDVPGCHTYGRTIKQARERIREALGLFVNDADTAVFVEKVNLPKPMRKTVDTALELRETVARQEAKMLSAQYKAVQALRRGRMKLGVRDVGALLGVSFQRVEQIEKQEPPPVMPGAIIAADQRSRSYVVKRAAKKR